MTDLLPVAEVAERLRAPAFVEVLPAPAAGDPRAYRDQRMSVIVPTRGAIHPLAVECWLKLIFPANQAHGWCWVPGFEVGEAYNEMISRATTHEEHGKWPFILTAEDDNLPPPHAVLQLVELLEEGRTEDGKPWDAVSAAYAMKDPRRLDTVVGLGLGGTVIDHRAALAAGREVVEADVIPQGFGLWRASIFRDLPFPWFETTTRGARERVRKWKSGEAGWASRVETQDASFCRKARALGKRFAIDLTCCVGHLDPASQVVYWPEGMGP